MVWRIAEPKALADHGRVFLVKTLHICPFSVENRVTLILYQEQITNWVMFVRLASQRKTDCTTVRGTRRSSFN